MIDTIHAVKQQSPLAPVMHAEARSFGTSCCIMVKAMLFSQFCATRYLFQKHKAIIVNGKANLFRMGCNVNYTGVGKSMFDSLSHSVYEIVKACQSSNGLA